MLRPWYHNSHMPCSVSSRILQKLFLRIFRRCLQCLSTLLECWGLLVEGILLTDPLESLFVFSKIFYIIFSKTYIIINTCNWVIDTPKPVLYILFRHCTIIIIIIIIIMYLFMNLWTKISSRVVSFLPKAAHFLPISIITRF